ncbi:MAG: relaxase domain-containing protein [Gammaproteobacteria bacterium]|nr:relaxase domain-containing protein [Gammaproteobacteria bacterium]
MTVRVTTLKGTGAGRYYTEHLPSYYLDGDEPPGRWWGRGAHRLGLSDEIDPEAFLAVMAGHDPATGQDLGRRMGEESVRGYDATFSAPKSVSVMFALGEPDVRRHVVEAHERAVEAVLGWVETHAHTRMRRRGHIVCVDTEGIVVGVFRQHTSRKLDPQMHTHAVIANRVRAPDGRWLALDARTIKVDQRTLSALYHAALRSELTRRLGVRWASPEHGIAEIADIDPEILAEFSQRTTDLQRRLGEKLTRFRADLARNPTPSERWKLEREAAIDSRPAKPHGISAAELRQEWQERVRALGRDPDRIIEAVVGRRRGLEGIDAATAARLVELALDSLAERQSTWRPAELIREMAAATPTTTTADSAELTDFLQRLADHVTTARCVDVSRPIPAGAALRRDGRPINESAVERTLTTEAILDEEEQLISWADRRRDGHTPADPIIRHGERLTPTQAEAAAVVAGHRGLELIVGPAGSGKTTMLASAVTELRAQGRPVFGVAPTAAAADVLAVETGMGADTLDKLLSEHRHTTRPPDPAYDLPAGATVIVDEAGTAATANLAELAGLADQSEWRVVLVGDPRQFSAVGRGGMFGHLVDAHGCAELDHVHRFRHVWERHASLRLRNGDPIVLTEYDQHGRLHGGTLNQMEEEVITAWQQARRRGETVALMANNTDTVARLNRLAQHTRLEAGELDPAKPSLQVGDESMLIGDEVVTRRNDRRLRTDRGQMVKNRDHWTITNIHPDSTVTLAGRTGAIRLPVKYVAEDLELGYAQTSHATQGRTVDVALLLVDAPTDSRGIYTPMTRGREGNDAYVAVDDNQTALDVLTQAIGRDWIDQPAVARRTQLDPRRDRQLDDPGDQEEYAKLERRIFHSIEQRRARARDAERTAGRGLV